jgi:hypothetical protein
MRAVVDDLLGTALRREADRLRTFAPFRLPGAALEWDAWPDEPAREEDWFIWGRST